MKICIIDNFMEAAADGLIRELRVKGHVVTPDLDGSYDVLICGSIEKMDKALDLMLKFPKVPLINYCWDYYKWAHEGKHGYLNWAKYAAFLKRGRIIVPSSTQALRIKELLGLDSHVVHTAINVYEHEVSDERFVLDPVRFYPEPNEKWVIEACTELGIPVIHSEHQFSKEEFRKLIHTCTFMTCGYQEASTGGLTLTEGLWNGKPSLVSDSPYMGGKEYLGRFGTHFKYDSFEDLKSKIKSMFYETPKVDIAEARAYISENFSSKTMADKIEKICELARN